MNGSQVVEKRAGDNILYAAGPVGMSLRMVFSQSLLHPFKDSMIPENSRGPAALYMAGGKLLETGTELTTFTSLV